MDLVKCRFGFDGTQAGLRVCVCSELAASAGAAGPQRELWVPGSAVSGRGVIRGPNYRMWEVLHQADQELKLEVDMQ